MVATVTAVRPPARFGGLTFDGDRSTAFTKKQQAGDGWINGGSFALEPSALNEIEGDNDIWERGQLAGYQHGFWQATGTLREKRLLEPL